jgi:hypothetical protein
MALSGRLPLPSDDPSQQEFGGKLWFVASGPCTIDEDECIYSPHYPANYQNDERCIVLVNGSSALPLTVERFDTEEGYDTLSIDCVLYSGSQGPHGVLPKERISWMSDRSAVGGGWKICPAYDNSSETSNFNLGPEA